MKDDIMATKINILLKKKEEVEESYLYLDEETKENYDKILALIELEFNLIKQLNPDIKIKTR